jgi:hypothetical protein
LGALVNDPNSLEVLANTNQGITDGTSPWLHNWYAAGGTNNPITVRVEGTNAIDNRDQKYSTAAEAGSVRFRRLVGLGYV